MTDRAVPEGWTQSTLGDVATIVMGQSPAGTSVVTWNGGAPPTTGLPFLQGNAEFSLRYPVPQKWCVEPAKVAEPGDTLISVRAPVGELNQADQRLAIGRGLAAVRFTSIGPKFGWHVIAYTKKGFERLAQGSTFDAIGGDHLRKLAIYVPPLSEQRAIAAILDSMDEAIERTEEVISATEYLRKALLQDLLTHGVPGWHTEWKHVPGIGTIPADWEVVRLGDVAEVATGFALGPERSPKTNYKPYLTVANVKANQITVTDVRYMEVTGSEHAARHLVEGDLVMVEGHAQVSELGRAALVPPEFRGFIFQNHLFRIRGDKYKCLNAFICAYVNGSSGRSYFKAFGGTTSGLNTVSATNVKRLRMPLPAREEQEAIVGLVSEHEWRLSQERETRQCLQVVKRAASDALLSGRVRVPVGVGVAE